LSPRRPFSAATHTALRSALTAALAIAALVAAPASTQAQQIWYVAPGGTGDGSAASAPLGRVQQGMQAAQPGDTVLVAPGTYAELISTVRPGLDGAPITVKSAAGRGAAIVTRAGQVLQVSHAWVVVDGLVLDAQYAATDAVRLTSAATAFVLRNSEVRRSGRDCIDMASPAGVLIEQSVIHRCLWWDGLQRQDAHGIVAGAVRGLTIRDVEIHTFSGDGIQLDPGRQLPGWDDLLVENTSIWLAPLSAAENGFPAGVVPGENGIDTKTHPSAPRASLVVRNTTARGFRNGLISNMAAFNLKENIDATLDGVTVSGSEIALRLRGPGSNGGAWARIRNAVIDDVLTGIRYEDDIELVDAAHVTFGLQVTRPFQAASSGWGGVQVRNTLVLGGTLPTEAPAAGRNLPVTSSAFADATSGNYRLVAGGGAVDAAQSIDGVNVDRDGNARVQGPAPDLGAYERAATSGPALPAPAVTVTSVASDPTNAVKVSWADVSGETGYEVERSADGVTFVRVATLAADRTSWSNAKLVSGQTYWYRVRAMSGLVAGPYSVGVAAVLPRETAPPSAPTGLTLTLSTSAPSSSIVLRWKDTSLAEDGFDVERSRDGVTFARIAVRDVNKTSATSSGLLSGQLYWYRVRAFNGLGPSDWTATASLTTR